MGIIWQRPIARQGWLNCNLRTTFSRLVKRAGLEAWPRLFHNLRASRETELLEEFPVHVVAQWLGHDAKVCLKHYAQTTEDHFDRASGGAESGALEAQKPAQQPLAGQRREPKPMPENDAGEAVIASPCDSSRHTTQISSGAEEIRTLDLCSAIAALYQLSYRPIRVCMIESSRLMTIPRGGIFRTVVSGVESFPGRLSRGRRPSGP